MQRSADQRDRPGRPRGRRAPPWRRTRRASSRCRRPPSAVARSARLPCRSRASSTADMVRLPMSDTLRGLRMPSRALDTRCRGNSSSPTKNRPAKMPNGAQPQRGRRIGCLRRRAGRRRSRRTRVYRVPAPRSWSAAPSWAARRGRRVCGGRRAAVVGGGRGGHGVGSTTGVSRSATRAKAAETPAGSSADGDPAQGQEAGEVGLRRREADGLDVLTLDGRDGLRPASRCCHRPCRPRGSRAPCARPPA